MTNNTHIEKDTQGKKIVATHIFDAQPKDVWKWWTESELLDQWWAPKPWHAETKHMEFKPGGQWLYAMVGPDGQRQWSRMDFESIDPVKKFSGKDTFCDEHGKKIDLPPGMLWKVTFDPNLQGTQVTAELSFDSEADMQAILQTGFEEGFTMALGNLDEYFSQNK